MPDKYDEVEVLPTMHPEVRSRYHIETEAHAKLFMRAPSAAIYWRKRFLQLKEECDGHR